MTISQDDKEQESRGVDSQYRRPFATASKNRVIPTYDDKQASAKLTTCWICKRAFYMTHPKFICMSCR